jgi:hypothetical protein
MMMKNGINNLSRNKKKENINSCSFFLQEVLIKLNLYLMLFYSYEIHNIMDYILHLQYSSNKIENLIKNICRN